MADFMEQARQLLRGAQRGASSDVLGMPVDVINMLLKALDSTKVLPQRFSTQEPFAGSEWWHRRLQNAGMAAPATDTPTEQMGRVLGGFAVNPTTVGKTGMLLEDFAKNRAEYYSSIAPFVSRAVKEPGGMWHPEAVDRLAAALDREALAGTNTWATDKVRKYLNKYAGTSRDPLKDVEVPVGDGVKRWEDIMDRAVRSTKNPITIDGNIPEWAVGMRSNEPFYYIANELGGGRATSPNIAIESYLSHVGDYLRQNVPADKLSQYDLVRAVQETYKNDLRVAKQMEKAAQQSAADLPVYKEYPEGYRWVELRKPEKLTPQQAKGVRAVKVTDGLLQRHPEFDDTPYPGRREVYQATDAEGKPIKSSYTGQVAFGRTPEEAYLAGRLAEEGNQMGHCVGGYCEDVASGASKIYSLRDAKGRSHVTVEVEGQGDPRRYTPEEWFDNVASQEVRDRIGWRPGKRARQDAIAADRAWNSLVMQEPGYKEWLDSRPQNISQIKGKQNRAPNPDYLPYVQDFVRSGKWGDVRDLENTGLWPIRTKSGSFFPPEFTDHKTQSHVLDKLTANNQSGYFTTQELLEMLKDMP